MESANLVKHWADRPPLAFIQHSTVKEAINTKGILLQGYSPEKCCNKDGNTITRQKSISAPLQPVVTTSPPAVLSIKIYTQFF